ncbi:LCP family protein [Paenibacillus methanolicus]|uniref:LCP family protein required for cell wall assembly n=1 Tax=Paenibacillus methanolicus TaxID=582686 RepID=A0A5S5CIB9_9BACL|nr:LCP family protein [Paenibacillus methanolicus]TYP79539.1 LCP family protein required for cell wall assembly [Paenibacillus methanolicus]
MQDKSQEPNAGGSPNSVQAKPKSRIWRKIIISVAIASTTFIVGSGAFAGYLYYKANQAFDKIAAQETEDAQQPVATVEPPAQPAKPLVDKPISFLLTGVDNREGSGGTMNADVLMLASYDPADKSAALMSVPRDLKIASDDHGTHKANYFFPYYYNKDKEAVIPNVKAFYSDLLQTPIDYMVVVDFAGLREIVDALGGLDLNVDMDMRYIDNADGTNIDLKQGQQKLGGKEVLDFVRYRKSNKGTEESSDMARNERQQQVLTQMVDKMSSLSGISQWGNILDIVGEHIRTDIPKDTLIDWIINYSSMKPATLNLNALEGVWDSPYIYVPESDLSAKLSAVRAKLALPALDMDDLKDHIGTIEDDESEELPQ